MKKVLIDTNVYSLAMKGEQSVIGLLRKIDQIGFSAISVGELFSGFKGGKKEETQAFRFNSGTCKNHRVAMKRISRKGAKTQRSEENLAA